LIREKIIVVRGKIDNSFLFVIIEKTHKLNKKFGASMLLKIRKNYEILISFQQD